MYFTFMKKYLWYHSRHHDVAEYCLHLIELFFFYFAISVLGIHIRTMDKTLLTNSAFRRSLFMSCLCAVFP